MLPEKAKNGWCVRGRDQDDLGIGAEVASRRARVPRSVQRKAPR
jgi:hypothetical protein